MAEYKEGQVAGNTWNRFSRVTIENPRAGTPSVVCAEDQVIALASGEIVRPVGNMGFMFNPGEEFALLDPVTNEPTGDSVTAAQVQQMVFSYVMHEAAKRDAQTATPTVLPLEPQVASDQPQLIEPQPVPPPASTDPIGGAE